MFSLHFEARDTYNVVLMILKTRFWRCYVVPRFRSAELDPRQPGSSRRLPAWYKIEIRNVVKEWIYTSSSRSNCGSCDRTGVVRRSKSNGACSNRLCACVGPRYVKCLRPKKERGEFVEILSNYKKAIYT